MSLPAHYCEHNRPRAICAECFPPKPAEPSQDARGKIEEWLGGMDKTHVAAGLRGANQFVATVRAALAAFDEDHKKMPWGECRCGRTNPPHPCWVKLGHEAALWKAISGGGE